MSTCFIMTELNSERLVLKPIRFLRFDDLRQMDTDPEVMKYIATGRTKTREESLAWMEKVNLHWSQHGYGMMAAYMRETGEFVGLAGVKNLDGTDLPEIGYRFCKKFWGMGLATEVCKRLIVYAFESLKFDKLVAVAIPENLASNHVLKKCGFIFKKTAYFYDTEVNYYELNPKNNT